MGGSKTTRGLLAAVLVAGAAHADRLELRDGRSFQGRYRGGDAHSVQFDSGNEVHLVPVEQIRRLVFGEASAPGEAHPAPAGHAKLGEAAPPATATPTTPAPAAVEIPLGTRLQIRLSDTVDPRVGAAGDRFAGLLENGLAADGRTLIPRGSRVYGVVAESRTQGPVTGRLKLELTELMVGGEMVPVVSGTHALVAPTRDAPPASAATRPDRITAGTLLEFRLLRAVELQLR